MKVYSLVAMEDDFKYEFKRPISIMIVAPVLILIGSMGFLGRLTMLDKHPLDTGVAIQVLLCAGGIGLWFMKRWGFWCAILSLCFTAYSYASISETPIRSFLYPGGPVILAVFALTWPNYKRMVWK